jgi:hypothetical protein
MEQSAEVYQPSRIYVRTGWASLACSIVCGLAGLHYPLAFIPSCVCVLAAAGLFWLGSQPPIRILPTQFNIGERAIAWREVREINTGLVCPLVIHIKLTNARQKIVVFPARSERIVRLMYQLRRHSYLATFDGVAYRDFWTWSTLSDTIRNRPALEQPVRMISTDEEDEIERMFQKLKAVGHLDARADDSKPRGN